MKLYPSMSQWQKWSLPSKLGYISFLFAIISIFLWGISYISGATKFNQEQIIQNQEGIKQVVRELKNAIIKGDQLLVQQTENKEEWDFKVGTFLHWIPMDLFFNGKELNLLIKSKENSASIRLHKNSNDYIRIIYTYPTIGEIIRGTQLTPNDFVAFEIDPMIIMKFARKDQIVSNFNKEPEITDCPKCVFLGFAWNLKEARTALYINGEERIQEAPNH